MLTSKLCKECNESPTIYLLSIYLPIQNSKKVRRRSSMGSATHSKGACGGGNLRLVSSHALILPHLLVYIFSIQFISMLECQCIESTHATQVSGKNSSSWILSFQNDECTIQSRCATVQKRQTCAQVKTVWSTQAFRSNTANTDYPCSTTKLNRAPVR